MTKISRAPAWVDERGTWEMNGLSVVLFAVLSAARDAEHSPHPGQDFCFVVSAQYRESFGMSCHKGILRP